MPVTLPLLLALAACGPSSETRDRIAQLEAQVQELKTAKDKVQKELEVSRDRVATLERQATASASDRVFSELGISSEGSVKAVIATSMGDIRCTLWPKVAPAAVLNFVQLSEGTKSWQDPRTGEQVKRPLYSGTTFHRVIPGFMIQGGDPLGTGTGGPGYSFADEIRPDVIFDHPGLLAMANAGPNTNGSQFFVTDAIPKGIDGRYTILGDCADSVGVVKSIAAVPRDRSDKPLADVTIKKVTIQRIKR
jgi:peptidyl-prolyl cis-trans isomerase A (cyclophilin A)